MTITTLLSDESRKMFSTFKDLCNYVEQPLQFNVLCLIISVKFESQQHTQGIVKSKQSSDFHSFSSIFVPFMKRICGGPHSFCHWRNPTLLPPGKQGISRTSTDWREKLRMVATTCNELLLDMVHPKEQKDNKRRKSFHQSDMGKLSYHHILA